MKHTKITLAETPEQFRRINEIVSQLQDELVSGNGLDQRDKRGDLARSVFYTDAITAYGRQLMGDPNFRVRYAQFNADLKADPKAVGGPIWPAPHPEVHLVGEDFPRVEFPLAEQPLALAKDLSFIHQAALGHVLRVAAQHQLGEHK